MIKMSRKIKECVVGMDFVEMHFAGDAASLPDVTRKKIMDALAEIMPPSVWIFTIEFEMNALAEPHGKHEPWVEPVQKERARQRHTKIKGEAQE